MSNGGVKLFIPRMKKIDFEHHFRRIGMIIRDRRGTPYWGMDLDGLVGTCHNTQNEVKEKLQSIFYYNERSGYYGDYVVLYRYGGYYAPYKLVHKEIILQIPRSIINNVSAYEILSDNGMINGSHYGSYTVRFYKNVNDVYQRTAN